ncbi:hypothetical protein [Nitrosopumilus sp.]|uniref:hypothetical protein n=1 Tax=Nitrosopumilus sp. TaxID=2024843 RepID=UPI003D09FA5C
MMTVSAKCPYCINTKSIISDRTGWLTHLSNHREDIIKHLTDTTFSCVFCTYPEPSANQKHMSSHYRWSHKKSIIINWAFENMEHQLVV